MASVACCMTHSLKLGSSLAQGLIYSAEKIADNMSTRSRRNQLTEILPAHRKHRDHSKNERTMQHFALFFDGHPKTDTLFKFCRPFIVKCQPYTLISIIVG